jgi:hypothetical protein
METKPEFGDALWQILRGLRPQPRSPWRRSTLSVSAPEIYAIRRVEASSVLRTLLKRKLIAPATR